MIGVSWVGHATVVVDVGGVRLITDPLLRACAGVLRRIGPVPDERLWADVDAVLISHLHHDHADLGSLRLLTGVPVLATAENASWLNRRGVPTRGVWEGWCTVPGRSGSVSVRPVRADHHSRPMPHRPNSACGFLVRAGDDVVWFGGDTSLYDDMTALPDLAEAPISLALVPIHGWGPRLSAGHMDPRRAAEACALASPGAVLPIHYGTLHPVGFSLADLDWMHRPSAEFAAALSELAPETKLVELGLGQSTSVG